MVENKELKLSDLKQGEWHLVRSDEPIQSNHDLVGSPTHYKIKHENGEVTVMNIFVTEEDKLETPEDWLSLSYPEAIKVSEEILTYFTSMAKYSFDTITLDDLLREVIYGKPSIVLDMAYSPESNKHKYPFYEEVVNLSNIVNLTDEEVLAMFQ